ncbi:pilus assembly PilX family protein [Variovorax sp. GT1P44]|uniref:pilus assembly PilX family protein n=1 Tax=Variovorax sp. GT1P44 TaxID=3443742 RepID=UPI003F469EC7
MRSPRAHAPSLQRGVVLLFCLIVLVILLAAGVAVVRSMNSSMFTAGNLAFRRDLVNQGEQAISQVLKSFAGGAALDGAVFPNVTATSLPSANYSAIELQTNAQGIPKLLLINGASPSGPDVTNATFTPTAGDITGRDGVKIRYVIDRLCNTTGTFAALGNNRCVYSPVSAATGGTAGEDRPAVSSPPLYRVTVRVTGPRETQVFLQSSFSKPE